MKMLHALFLCGAALALYGCDQGTNTPGGPGTAIPDSEKPLLGETANTFTLDVPMIATSVKQGEMDTVSIGIDRGTNFDQDVALTLSDVPPGVTIDPASPVLSRTEETEELTVRAAPDAALGDFIVKISGRPDTGASANAELKLSIGEGDAAAPTQP